MDTSMSTPEQPRKSLSMHKEVTRFALGALLSCEIGRVFPSEEDRKWGYEAIRKFSEHLDLPGRVRETFLEMASSQAFGEIDGLVLAIQHSDELGASHEPLIQEVLSYGICDGCYDARFRVLVCKFAALLGLKDETVNSAESAVVEKLQNEEGEETKEKREERLRRQKIEKRKRFALIGAATIAGGALLALTGGLAAPLVATGVGAVVGSGTAAVLGSAGGLAAITSLFGATGAGLAGYKMSRRVGGLKEFKFLPLSETRHLHIAISVTGWITSDSEDCILSPWKALDHSPEQYILQWESEHLKKLGSAMSDIITGTIAGTVATEFLKRSVLSAVLAAITWPATLLKVADIIDNPWSVCANRAKHCGHVLADVLLSQKQGYRPVTLIGFSLGARVIFYCLTEMARRRDCRGIVENAILLGAPVSANSDDWAVLTKVVVGRLVNGYSRSDWILKFLCRTASAQFKIAGLMPIQLDHQVMCNVDLTDIVDGHGSYASQLSRVLTVCGVKCKDSGIKSGGDSCE